MVPPWTRKSFFFSFILHGSLTSPRHSPLGRETELNPGFSSTHQVSLHLEEIWIKQHSLFSSKAYQERDSIMSSLKASLPPTIFLKYSVQSTIRPFSFPALKTEWRGASPRKSCKKSWKFWSVPPGKGKKRGGGASSLWAWGGGGRRLNSKFGEYLKPFRIGCPVGDYYMLTARQWLPWLKCPLIRSAIFSGE